MNASTPKHSPLPREQSAKQLDKPLQEKGYIESMDHLKEQSVLLNKSIFRGTHRHSYLQVGSTFSYTYFTAWSFSYKNSYNLIKDTPDPAILNLYSIQPLQAIHYDHNCSNELGIMLHPIELIVIARYMIELQRRPVIIYDVIPTNYISEHKLGGMTI